MSIWQKKGLRLTKMQLNKWNLKYHYLLMGKPSFDLFVDDKAYGFKKNLSKDVEKYLIFK